MTLHHLMEIGLAIDFDRSIDITNLLAQAPEGTDLMANAQTTWDDFIKTGKAGAFAFGLVMGYIIRGITR